MSNALRKSLNISVDFDDTISYYQQYVMRKVNKELGTFLDVSDIIDWDLNKCFTKEIVKAIYQIYDGDTNYQEVLANFNAINTLHSLHNDGHYITILTSGFGKSNIVKQKIEWLERYLPFLSIKNIAFVGNKNITFGDVIIDDAWHNIVNAKYDCKILIPYEWNRKEFEKSGIDIIRTDDWNRIYTICNDFSLKK